MTVLARNYWASFHIADFLTPYESRFLPLSLSLLVPQGCQSSAECVSTQKKAQVCMWCLHSPISGVWCGCKLCVSVPGFCTQPPPAAVWSGLAPAPSLSAGSSNPPSPRPSPRRPRQAPRSRRPARDPLCWKDYCTSHSLPPWTNEAEKKEDMLEKKTR